MPTSPLEIISHLHCSTHQLPKSSHTTAMSPPTDSNFNPFVWMRCPPTWDAEVFTYNYVCKYNGKVFDILLSPNTLPGYDAANSIETQYLQRLEAVSSCDGEDDEVVARML